MPFNPQGMSSEMKSRTFFFYYLIISLVLISAPSIPGVNAQEQNNWWSSPLRLSSTQGKASEAYMATDQYGYVHTFWTEYLSDDRTIIQYSRFDGESWTVPFDIYISKPFFTIGNLSPVVDQHGTLHFMWTEANGKYIMYSRAPAHDALSAQKWEKPYQINIAANVVKLKIDSNDVFHILFTREIGLQPGVFYSSSEDEGFSWSDPTWLDQDILSGYFPASLQFEMDDYGGLHAAWYYSAQDGSGGDWVRYAHSSDAGRTWSSPYTIDRVGEIVGEVDYQLNAADPVMIVNGRDVQIVWAGGKLHYRHHRISRDLGQTWSPSTRFMGDLNGQAGDGLVVDGLGRVHYFAQIRFPMGIYHAIWSQDHWSLPELIYLIKYESSSEKDGTTSNTIGDRIMAHATYPIILSGNQLILTFTDPPPDPQRRLFVMYRNLEDVPKSTTIPTPTEMATLAPQLIPTLVPTLKATELPASLRINPSSASVSSPGYAISLGFIPALILVIVAIIVQFLAKHKH